MVAKENIFCQHHTKKFGEKVLPSNPHNQVLLRVYLITVITAVIGLLAIWAAKLLGTNVDKSIAFLGAYFVTMFGHAIIERNNPLKSLLVAPILFYIFTILSFTKYGLESNLKWLLFPVVLPVWLVWGQNFSFWPSLGVFILGILASIIFSLVLIAIRISKMKYHLRSGLRLKYSD